MRILAIETTDQTGSIAALDDDRVLVGRDLNSSVRSAVSLAPSIAEVLDEAAWRARDVELVAVATGPGSFTGLRVGVTTAKMFAYAVSSQVLGVNTLEIIAHQAPVSKGELWTILDAQRNQLFVARFSRGPDGDWQWRGETMLLDDDAWIAQLSASEVRESTTAVSGPALAKLADKVPAWVTKIDRSRWQPKATAVGQLAWYKHQAGVRLEAAELVPRYFRPSAAEEKRASHLKPAG